MTDVVNRYETPALVVVMVIFTALAWRHVLTHDAAGMSFYTDPFGVIVASPLYAVVVTLLTVFFVQHVVRR